MATKHVKGDSDELKEARRIEQEIAKMREQYEALMRTEGSRMVMVAFNAAQKLCPDLGVIAWSQYSPHWNDGEPCVFGVCESFAGPKGTDVSKLSSPYRLDDVSKEDAEAHPAFYAERTYNDGTRKYYVLSDLAHGAKNAFDSFIQSRDTMLALFGDHKDIFVTEAGVEVRDCDHD